MERSERYAAELEKRRQRREALAARCGALREETRPLVFEPGCGHGHWLVAFAERRPDLFCLGIDLVAERVRKAEAKRAKRGIGNAMFLKAEFNECLGALPESARLGMTVFLFPDPWPKKRHHRRRMIQNASLTRLAERSEPGAPLYFRTDDRGYFEWTREVLEAHPAWRIDDALEWPFELATFFQNKMDRFDSLGARRVER